MRTAEDFELEISKLNTLVSEAEAVANKIAAERDAALQNVPSELQAIEILVKAYVEKKFNYKLLYPSIIVRVLPKPDHFGMLILPEAYRNKPVYEGVVMQTWEKKTIPTHKGVITVEPSVKQGDVVLFHHWAGIPVPGFNDDEQWRILSDKSVFNKPGHLDDPSPFCLIDLETLNPLLEMQYIINRYFATDIYRAKFYEELVNAFDITVKTKIASTSYIEPTKSD